MTGIAPTPLAELPVDGGPVRYEDRGDEGEAVLLVHAGAFSSWFILLVDSRQLHELSSRDGPVVGHAEKDMAERRQRLIHRGHRVEQRWHRASSDLGPIRWRRAMGRSWLRGPFDLGIQIPLSRCGPAAATAVPAKQEREANRDRSSRQRPRDIDPVVPEVGSDQVGTECACGVHRRARDRTAPQAREDDVGAHAQRADHAEVLRA